MLVPIWFSRQIRCPHKPFSVPNEKLKWRLWRLRLTSDSTPSWASATRQFGSTKETGALHNIVVRHTFFTEFTPTFLAFAVILNSQRRPSPSRKGNRPIGRWKGIPVNQSVGTPLTALGMRGKKQERYRLRVGSVFSSPRHGRLWLSCLPSQ